jgi:membrane-associated phospholipid phosphatase
MSAALLALVLAAQPEPFEPWQYGTTGALLSWSFIAKFGLPEQNSDFGPLPYELEISRALMVGDEYEPAIQLLTDASLAIGLLYPLLDSIFAAGVAHGDWDLAFQTSMISIQSIAAYLAVLWSAQAAVGRERPHARICRDDPLNAPDYACQFEPDEVNRSFLGGHTGAAWVGAGLTCLNHTQLPLYGGGWPDYLACGLMIGNAVLNGVGRLAIGSHYLSDVLLGAGVGVLTGFVLPALLHWGFR